mmetsp:Transcript_89413/g.289166  ORF Transcript_89413/g.289166 Transcript_89413/m.289166 type:complete len:245 (+) Transcript_89413:164-898(+)
MVQWRETEERRLAEGHSAGGRDIFVRALREERRLPALGPEAGALAREGEGDPAALLELVHEVRVELVHAGACLGPGHEVGEVIVLEFMNRRGRVAEPRGRRRLVQRGQRPGLPHGLHGLAGAAAAEGHGGHRRLVGPAHLLSVVHHECVPIVGRLHAWHRVALAGVGDVDLLGGVQVPLGEPVPDGARVAEAKRGRSARQVHRRARRVGAPREGPHLILDLISRLEGIRLGFETHGVETVRHPP